MVRIVKIVAMSCWNFIMGGLYLFLNGIPGTILYALRYALRFAFLLLHHRQFICLLEVKDLNLQCTVGFRVVVTVISKIQPSTLNPPSTVQYNVQTQCNHPEMI